jgi:hypothetical protein
MLTSKLEKHIGSGFNTLIFGSNIQKRTCFSGGISEEQEIVRLN